MSPSDKRTIAPNKRTLELALSAKTPKRAILHDFQEPEYACRDVEIRDGIWSIMDLMEGFSEEFFAFEVHVGSIGRLPESFFKQFSVDSAKVIGCVASGGPAGVQGWHDLFFDEQKRRAVAMAVVGNVLVEQVFGHLFFGGTEEQIKHMTELQDDFKDEDGNECTDAKTGFDRNAHYAAYMRSVLNADKTGACNLSANFANHVNLIVGAIYTHLKPILGLSSHRATLEAIIPPLHTIVTQAGLLSLSMRLDPHTVYHFTPIFKEDTFTSTRMECFNKVQMEQQHPRTPASEPRLTRTEKARRATLSEAEKKRATNDDPLTQITIMDGVTAYRLGGWEIPASTTTSRRYEKPEWASRGVRMRALTQGWVYCRWGRARSLQDGKGNDGPAAHGVAWDGGFKEFRDVEGVVDWLRLEREGKKEAFEEAEKAMKKGKAVTEADLQTQLREEIDG
ncbi:hypothetical protein BDU57DRAFT_500560 [Ampelomyces quisqualis]|uniref:Uncharacterized protein n=1 Tax=Ampelomyces quisqualis TaxID=50730 RepID=A0A6A5QFZ6_AMPQU|nr:hypothetical protein BDU57DRAFT_500560 [Ampelomyces quisqualis]